MSKTLKRILSISLLVIGFLAFIFLYVLVIINKADYVKYIVTLIGYLSVAVFTVGIFLLKSTFNKNEK